MTICLRFAPSPTGFLHIGNARAALINWLFARAHMLQGQEAHFMLRLDDTDTARSEERFEKQIHEDLAWLGLTHTSYAKQSMRFDRYTEVVETLKASGRLYPCFEAPEELDFKRKRQLGRGEPPIYDRAALALTDAQKADLIAAGHRPHWRFLLEDKDVSWTDLVRGPTLFHGHTLSDPVLIRADGAYLYTLTSVIDDIDFNITHVLRGEDHVTNTSVQCQLFEALGKDLSTLHFGHTTLLMDAAGGPLSKRLGSLSLKDLRAQGIEAMALNSLLARLGTSQPIEPKQTLDELAATFDLSHFSRTPPRFDHQDLYTLNHKIFHDMTFATMEKRLMDENITTQIPEPTWLVIRNNIDELYDVEMWKHICHGCIMPVYELSDRDYLAEALALLPDAPWTETTWKLWTDALKDKTNRRGKALFMPLRQAITGMEHGPEMKDLLVLIGRDRVAERLTCALEGPE